MHFSGIKITQFCFFNGFFTVIWVADASAIWQNRYLFLQSMYKFPHLSQKKSYKAIQNSAHVLSSSQLIFLFFFCDNLGNNSQLTGSPK